MIYDFALSFHTVSLIEVKSSFITVPLAISFYAGSAPLFFLVIFMSYDPYIEFTIFDLLPYSFVVKWSF